MTETTMKKIPFSVARRCLAMLLLLATQRSGATGLATCDPWASTVEEQPSAVQAKYTPGAALTVQAGQSWLNTPTPRMPLAPRLAPKSVPEFLQAAGTVP